MEVRFICRWVNNDVRARLWEQCRGVGGGGSVQSPQLTSRTQAPWLILAATTATENHNYAVYNTYTWATRRDTQCLPFTFCKSRPHPSGPGFRCSRIWGQNRPPMLYSLLWHTSSLTGDRIRKVFCSRKKKKEMEKKKYRQDYMTSPLPDMITRF